MIALFHPYVKKMLAALGEPLIYVDVGARNGMFEMASIAPYVKAYGFEANPEEYEKLQTQNTDVSHLGVSAPRYVETRYAPYAVSNVNGRQDLYVTCGAGACGILEPNLERLREITWRSRKYATSFGDEVFQVKKVVPVEVRTLSSFAEQNKINRIDFLKIDVEGVEYEVLEGAGDLLARTGVIKAEVCFIPFRKNQKMFSHIDLLLRSYGFDLIKFETVQAQVGYKERDYPFSIGPAVGWPDRYGQPLSCDAIYVNRGLTGPSAVAQAAVLIEKNYLDEALFVLKHRTDLQDPEFFHLLKSWKGTWRTRVFNAAAGLFLLLDKWSRPVRTYRRWLGWRRLRRELAGG